MSTIELPEQLAAFTADTLSFDVDCDRLSVAFKQIFERFPLVREVLFPREGFFNNRCLMSLNDEQLDIDSLGDLEAYRLNRGDRVVVIMAAAGG